MSDSRFSFSEDLFLACGGCTFQGCWKSPFPLTVLDRFHHYPALSRMYCGRLVGMVILIGWIWFLVVILTGISPVIIRDAEHIVLWQFGFFFLKGVREIYLLPLASLKLVVFAIYFCNICCRTFPEGGHVCVLSRFSHVWLSVTLWTIAHQATLSMGFSRQEYWNRLPCPPPRDLLDPGIKPASLCLLHWQAVLYR